MKFHYFRKGVDYVNVRFTRGLNELNRNALPERKRRFNGVIVGENFSHTHTQICFKSTENTLSFSSIL